MVGMGMFYINGQMFDLNVINDTIQLGAMEIWEIENISNMAHPFHIHGGSFYILDRDGIAPPLWEQGAKDVVLVDAGAGVRVIMRFDDYITDGWPFMYHCHNLLHEDNMMMAQYIVVDQNVAVVDVIEAPAISVFPSPTSSSINYSVPFAATELRLFDGNGRAVVHLVGPIVPTGAIDLGGLPSGPYMLVVNSRTQVARTVVMKE